MKNQIIHIMKLSYSNRFASLALAFASFTVAASANTYNWTDVAGNTSVAGNWSPAISPNGVSVAGDILNLNIGLTAPRTAALDGLVVAGTLNIGDTTTVNAFTLAATTGGNLTMDAITGSAAINKASGANANDLISAGLQFNDTLAITNASTVGSLTLSGGMSSVLSDITFNGAGAITVSTAAIATGGNLIKNDAGTTTLSFANTYAGATTINGGKLNLTTATALPGRSAVTVGSGATLAYLSTNTIIGSLAGSGNVTNSSVFNNQILQIGRDDTSTTFSGQFLSTTNMGITKIGAGTLTLVPTLASTYTGATTIFGGTVKLDFANTSLTSLLAATPLTLTGGGNFTMVGKAGLAADQTLGGFTVGAGGSITMVAGDTAGTTLRMGAPTAGAAGGTLLITAPANTKVFINAAYKNLTPMNSRLVFSDGTANTFNWVQNNNSASTAVFAAGTGAGAYIALPVSGGNTSTAYILTAGQIQTTANTTINSLKLSSTSGSAQTLDLSTFNMTLGINANSPGGILIDGTAAWNINGSSGVLNAASASDLIFQQYNTSNPVTVNAGIANGPALMSLTKAGPGTLVLAGANTFTGSVFVGGGNLSFSNVTAGGAGSLGNGSTTAVTISDGATLQYTGGSGAISGTAATAGAHTFTLQGGNDAINVSAAATELTLNGAISGGGSLVKQGAGTLTITGTNTYSGGTTLSAGTLALSGGALITNTASIVVASNAIFNVSGLTTTQPFTLGKSLFSQTLANSAPGAIINGTNDCTKGTLSLVYDGVNPSFLITNGGMTLSASTTFKVKNSGTQLAANTSYKLIAKATAGAVGLVAGAVTASPVTVDGNGAAATATLAITGGELWLNVASGSLSPSTISYSATGPFTYNGAAQTPTISFSGSTGSKTTNYVGVAPTSYGPSAAAPVNVGTYALTNTVLADVNYYGATNGLTFTIGAKAASVTADAKTKTYGDVNPVLTAVTNGAVNGDVINITLATDATQFSSVGISNITVTLGSNPNYSVLTTNSTLTISQASTFVGASSTKNPSGYKDSVSYTATLPADATGSVVFSSTNGAFSTNAVSGVTTTSLSITNLPRGTNVITVAYLGNGNYVGSTNTLNQIVTNHPPMANVMTVTRTAGLPLMIALSDVATNWTDIPDGDLVSLPGVTMQSTNGVNLFPLNWSTNLDGSIVTTNAYAFIGYTNSPNVADQISYSISDGQGGTNIGYVDIVIQSSATGTNSITGHDFTSPYSNTITAYGIPNFYYVLERATNLTSPVWVEVQTNQAATNGVINVADTFWDLGGVKPSPSAFYQLKWQP